MKKVITIPLGILLALLCALLLFYSCEKAPGPGGRATVKGKVYARDFDNTQNYLISQGYASGEKVYIMYGDHTVIDNSTTTAGDGSYEFRHLNKGHYKVYANSLDTVNKIKGNDTEYAIIKEFDITGTREVMELEDIRINK